MKYIIRQAVADAAEWLYQNRGSATRDWLFRTPAEGIIRAQVAASEHDDRKRREALLADFVANPILERPRIDSGPVIIPTVTITHAAFDDDVTVVGKPRIDSALIIGPGGKVVHGVDTYLYNRRRREVADAAWFLFDRFPSWGKDVMVKSPNWILAEAARRGHGQNVAVPRALIERLAKIENIPNNEDQGPGYDACPACGRCSNWQWKAGKVVAKPPIEHDPDCALEAIRKLL